MVGIVIVSHSPKIAQGVKEMIDQMIRQRVTIVAAGGEDDERLGSNSERIHNALVQADGGDGVLVLVDLGNVVLSAQIAIEMLPEEKQAQVVISEAPLVEGAIIAAVQASIGNDLTEVNAAAEAARTMQKIL
jgi:PTS hybrid protein